MQAYFLNVKLSIRLSQSHWSDLHEDTKIVDKERKRKYEEMHWKIYTTNMTTSTLIHINGVWTISYTKYLLLASSKFWIELVCKINIEIFNSQIIW